MKKTNDADMLAAIVRASNRYAMRPALVIDDRTYTYQELFGLAGSICETLRNLKEDIIGITAETVWKPTHPFWRCCFPEKHTSCCIPIIRQNATAG